MKKGRKMKYLEDLIREAENITVRLEESMDLILCCGAKSILEKKINITVLKKYTSVITSVNGLRDLLHDIREYETKSKLLDYMTKDKA